VPSPWLALPAGTDPSVLSRAVANAYDDFVTTGTPRSRVRDIVFDSWRRSRANGIDPDASLPPVDLVDDALEDYRQAHPLAEVMPMIRQLLVEDAVDCDLLVAVSDGVGRLLWVEGAPQLRTRAEAMNFVPGAFWSEDHAGTNAPGTALALDHAVQIFAHEHFSRIVQPWSCSAAPIHDPRTGALLGVLDVTGGDTVAAPQSLALVQAAAAAVENELRVRRLQPAAHRDSRRRASPGPKATADPTPRLAVLGTDRGQWVVPGSSLSLSLRHSEILLLLTEHPRGLSSEQLGVLLHEDELADVTVRAEMSRLRSALGPLALLSRPYRLTSLVGTDITDVQARLARGQLSAALELYVGPVLPRSDAPGVVEIRRRLAHQIRAAVLVQGDADDLARYGETSDGREDSEVWSQVARVASAGSALRTVATARLAWIDQSYGTSGT
jgi:hypothetical protein